MLRATFATNSGLFQTGEGFFSAQREQVGGDARAHIRTGCFLILKTYVTMIL